MSKAGSAIKRLARKKETKKVVHGSFLRVTIPAQKASASPPLGPQVGERGLNAVQFAKDFNKATEHIIEGVPVPTRVHINPDRTYKIQFTTPPIPWLLKQAAGISKGSFHGDVSGMVTLKHIYEIAKVKQQDDVNMGLPLKRLCQTVMGYARTCGIEVRKEIDPAEYRQFLQSREDFVKKELEELQAKRQAKIHSFIGYTYCHVVSEFFYASLCILTLGLSVQSSEASMDPSETISPFLRLMNELQNNSGRKIPSNPRRDRCVSNNSLIEASKLPPYDQRKGTVKPMHERNDVPLADSAAILNPSDKRPIENTDSVASHADPLKLVADQRSNVPSRKQAQRDTIRTTSNYKAMVRQLTLNATIRNVKEWSAYQGLYLSLLFDIYSVLDSDISYNRFGGSQFTLRDQTGCLVATYYAIDEDIVPAKVGDWLRVEGVVRSWGFQATSVKYAEANFLKGFREKIIASKIALENRLQQLYG
ncbi:hypothetical protein M513_11425 [Trichuris suis]|uniref:Large ribosomal subunit protein uL11m n=1 Tax=Trichuris suis TaxID=68888 RepID=A0A085LRU6_9BILA|nr:hypothetical protein M513_11425 [Trichuris suis]